MSEYTTDHSNLTFSQAAGIDPLPQPAKLGELPWRTRNAFWSRTYHWINESRGINYYEGMSYGIVGEPWDSMLYDFHMVILNKPGDEFDGNLSIQLSTIKTLFLKDPYNRVFDFLQFIMRHESVPDGFREFVDTTLQESMCAYSIVEDVWTIVPSAIPEQQRSIERAFRILKDGPFGGVRQHLSNSSECLNSGDYSGSVRESIHAVESVVRRIDNNSRKSLAPALESLSKRGLVLHGAFKSGIEKLYGYTSDEDGIRHSLSDATTNVDAADAVFMFGACASFAAFLVEKARGAGISIEE